VFERVRPTAPVPAPAVAAKPTSAPIRRQLAVGAVDDRAEREADRVARDVVGWLDSAGETSGTPRAPTRIARGTWGTIQRTPYLHNADDRIYRDSKKGEAEFAFMGTFSFLPNAKVFVPFTAVHELRDVADEVHRKIMRSRKTTTKMDRTKPRASAQGPYTRSSGRAVGSSKTGYGMNYGDEHRDVSERMRKVAHTPKPVDSDTKVLRKNLMAALGGVYGWYGEDQWEDLTHDLPPVKLATVIMKVIEVGPALMPSGGGSRLPPASGKIHSVPPRTAEEVFRILGVPADKQGAFGAVEMVGYDEPEGYIAKRDELAGGDANIFMMEDATTGVWMFYESDVAVKRSDNSRIQVGGSSLTDEQFNAIDPVKDAEFVRNLAVSYAQLRATADSGWISGTEMTASQDRGPGQAHAMKFWNALGAAAYANRFHAQHYDLAQNWEWLHIRGAQIGGQTEMGNLIPGFYTTNSAMIPYENMVKQWALADPTRFQARFQAIGVNGVFATAIRISIKAVAQPDPMVGGPRGHQVLGVLEGPLIDFDPLGGRVIDRMAGEFSKRNVDLDFRI
jgi:hypothetical protein